MVQTMTTNEIARFKRYFDQKSIHVSSYWLECCVEWFKESHEGYTEQEMLNVVLQQWLDCDIREIEVRSLPPNLVTEKKRILPGNYAVQLMYVKDISRSSLSQLKKIRDMYKLTRSLPDNDSEPSSGTGKRMLYLYLTDGVQQIVAFEYQPIKVIDLTITPGVKLLLLGPLIIRNGEILLKDNNLKILGGQVETLLVSNCVENVLARELNMPENKTPGKIDVIIENIATNSNTNVNQMQTTRNNVNQAATSRPQNAQNKINQAQTAQKPQTNVNQMQTTRNNINQATTSRPQNAQTNINQAQTAQIPQTNVNQVQNNQRNINQEQSHTNQAQMPQTNKRLNQRNQALNLAHRSVNQARILPINPPLSKQRNPTLNSPQKHLTPEKRLSQPQTSSNSLMDDDSVFTDFDTQQIVSSTNEIIDSTEDIEFMNIDIDNLEKPQNHERLTELLSQEQNFDFNIDDELDMMEQIENELEQEAIVVPVIATAQPYVYISQLLECRAKITTQRFRVKARFTRVVEKITVNKTRGWYMQFEIMDCTGRIVVDFISDVLEEMMGLSPAEAIAERRDVRQKKSTSYEKIAEAIIRCKLKLQSIDGLIDLQFEENTEMPKIVFIESIKRSHLHQLQDRVDKTNVVFT